MERIADSAGIIIISSIFLAMLIGGAFAYIINFTDFVKLRTVETISRDLSSIATIAASSDKPIEIDYDLKKVEEAVYAIELRGDPDTREATSMIVHIEKTNVRDTPSETTTDRDEKKLPRLNASLYASPTSKMGFGTLNNVCEVRVMKNQTEDIIKIIKTGSC